MKCFKIFILIMLFFFSACDKLKKKQCPCYANSLSVSIKDSIRSSIDSITVFEYEKSSNFKTIISSKTYGVNMQNSLKVDSIDRNTFSCVLCSIYSSNDYMINFPKWKRAFKIYEITEIIPTMDCDELRNNGGSCDKLIESYKIDGVEYDNSVSKYKVTLHR